MADSNSGKAILAMGGERGGCAIFAHFGSGFIDEIFVIISGDFFDCAADGAFGREEEGAKKSDKHCDDCSNDNNDNGFLNP